MNEYLSAVRRLSSRHLADQLPDVNKPWVPAARLWSGAARFDAPFATKDASLYPSTDNIDA